jgi:hypothetical protein
MNKVHSESANPIMRNTMQLILVRAIMPDRSMTPYAPLPMFLAIRHLLIVMSGTRATVYEFENNMRRRSDRIRLSIPNTDNRQQERLVSLEQIHNLHPVPF